MTRRPLAARAALAGAALLPLADAGAQPATRPGSTSAHGRVFVDGATLCQTSTTVAFDRTCAGSGVRAEIRADVGADRRLHAEASMIDGRFRSQDQPHAFAEAGYAERLTFTGPVVPEYLRFTLFIHGSVGGSPASHGVLTLWHGASEPRTSISIEGSTSGGPPPVSTWPIVTVPTARVARQTILLPVVRGRVDFALALRAHVLLPVRDDEGEVHCPGGFCPVRAARAAFFQTAGVERLEGFDANGDAITGGLQLGTASGATYALVGAAPTSTVPEPGTWTLLATGLAATAVAVRRRRAAGA